jgi:copper homeostasis protein
MAHGIPLTATPVAAGVPFVEICVETLAGARAAVAGGADQIELCSALALGGLTPSAGLVRTVVGLARPARVAVRAMVRPRAGGFDYDDGDLAVAAEEGRALLAEGVDGLVFGATCGGRLDRHALLCWREAVGSPALTIHRAIDVTADPLAAVDDAIALGADQILSSGAARSAIDGAAMLGRMTARAGDRCRVVAAAGVRPAVVPALAAAGIRAIHGSARCGEAGERPADRFGFGDAPQPADEAVVRALRASLLATLHPTSPVHETP